MCVDMCLFFYLLHLSNYLSVCLFVCLSVCLSFSLSLSFSLCLSICLHLTIPLSFSLYVRVFMYLFVSQVYFVEIKNNRVDIPAYHWWEILISKCWLSGDVSLHTVNMINDSSSFDVNNVLTGEKTS